MDKEKRDLMNENYKVRTKNSELEERLEYLKDQYEKLVCQNREKYVEILRLIEKIESLNSHYEMVLEEDKFIAIDLKKKNDDLLNEVYNLKETVKRQEGLLDDSTQTINSLKRDREYYKNKLKEVEQEYLDYKTYILNKYYKEEDQIVMIDHGFLR